MTGMAATAEHLAAGLEQVRAAPRDAGLLELIACRPGVGEREVLERAELDVERGLLGDSWSLRGKRPNPKVQLTLMNARVAQLVARSRERWALAGDQLYVDLDLSVENLPAGTRLVVGEAVLEVSDVPHTGCAKFTARFGSEAVKLVNKDAGRELRLRGMNARVLTAGTVRVGDPVVKLER